MRTRLRGGRRGISISRRSGTTSRRRSTKRSSRSSMRGGWRGRTLRRRNKFLRRKSSKLPNNPKFLERKTHQELIASRGSHQFRQQYQAYHHHQSRGKYPRSRNPNNKEGCSRINRRYSISQSTMILCGISSTGCTPYHQRTFSSNQTSQTTTLSLLN